jgi:hypothetical protein
MKIKIDSKNTAALEAALENANGRSTAHTFKWAFEIIGLAQQAEAQLQSLGLAKGSRSGAIATANSGGKVPNAYKYTRITTIAILQRGSSAWFLVEIGTAESFRRTAGAVHVSLTPAQDAEVTATFRSQFRKQPVTTVSVGGAA